MCLEDRCEHLAVPAADVDDVADTGKVIGLGDGRAGKRRHCAHCLIEDRREVGMPLVVGEAAVQAVEDLIGVLTGLDAFGEARERLPEAVAPEHRNERAHRVWHVRAQALPDRCQLELSSA
jgi:hypothetical protein